jgi:hypothetical protein
MFISSKEVINNILDQREEILKAFIAKWGYEPDEVEQVHEKQPYGDIYYIQKRETSDSRKENIVNPYKKVFNLSKEGVKYDTGKARYDLLPFDALEELTKIYTSGAIKYEDRNWEKGIKFSRIIAAIFRHLTAWILGETNDKESNFHHLAHAAWGCLAIVTFQKRKQDEWNDIQKRKQAKETNPNLVSINCHMCGAKETDPDKFDDFDKHHKCKIFR